MLKRYKTTQEGSDVRVHDVPIFSEISRDIPDEDGGITTFTYDENWINTAVNEANRRQEQNKSLPILYVEHDDGKSKRREVAGVFENQNTQLVMHDGKPTIVVFADLVITEPDIFKEMKKHQLPGMSVEIRDSQENDPQTFSSAALLNKKPAALKFPPLFVEDPTVSITTFSEIKRINPQGKIPSYSVMCFSEFEDFGMIGIAPKAFEEEPKEDTTQLAVNEAASVQQLMELYSRGAKLLMDLIKVVDDTSPNSQIRLAMMRERDEIEEQINKAVEELRSANIDKSTIEISGSVPDEDSKEIETDSKIGVDRIDMPQLSGDELNNFLGSLIGQGVKVDQKSVPANSLKPSQEKLEADKVEALSKNIDEIVDKPILVSSDNFIADGHHRWAAIKESGPKEIKILKIDLPITKLLMKANGFVNKSQDFNEAEDLDDALKAMHLKHHAEPPFNAEYAEEKKKAPRTYAEEDSMGARIMALRSRLDSMNGEEFGVKDEEEFELIPPPTKDSPLREKAAHKIRKFKIGRDVKQLRTREAKQAQRQSAPMMGAPREIRKPLFKASRFNPNIPGTVPVFGENSMDDRIQELRNSLDRIKEMQHA